MNYTYKQIWLINLPVMMSVLMEQLINITDAVFLGHVGEVELGASALAGIYYLATYMLGFGFSIGLQVMIARRNGEQNYAETGRTFFQGLFFLSGLALSLCLLIQGLSPFLLKQLITSPEIYQAVTDYLDWRSFGLLFSFQEENAIPLNIWLTPKAKIVLLRKDFKGLESEYKIYAEPGDLI